MFEKKTQLYCLYKVYVAVQSLGYWPRGYERGPAGTLFRARQQRRGLRQKDRPVTSLRHQGGEEFSEKGTIFLTMSNRF